MTLCFAVLTTLLDLIPPWLIKMIIDFLVEDKGQSVVYWTAGGLVLAYLARNLSNYIRIMLNNKLEQKVIFDLRSHVYRCLQTLSLSYFENRSTGEIMSRVNEDVNNVERVFIDGIEQVVTALLTLTGVVVILFFMHWKLALISLIPIPILFFSAFKYTHRAQELYLINRKRSARLNAFLQDTISGIRETLAFNRSQHEVERFDERSQDYCQSILQVMRLWALYSPAMMFLGSLGTVFIIFYGIGLVRTDEISVGSLIAFIGYLALFYTPVNQLHSLNNMLQQALVSGKRVFEIIDTPPEIKDGPNALFPADKVEGKITFDQVNFSYIEGRQVLHDISFQIQPGEKIALVGHTGSGKSTIIKLLMRFYENNSGTISMDQHNIRDLNITYLREQMGLVSQDPFLFNGTVSENILYGKLDADPSEVVHAAKASFSHEFIETLPKGYETVVGERGVKLSGGERHRIAIARAFLKNPPILILDEATATVDTETESKIKEALKNLMQSRTTIIIAHRLSTLEDADRILTIKDGRLMESGRHEDLIGKNSIYANLFKTQVHL